MNRAEAVSKLIERMLDFTEPLSSQPEAHIQPGISYTPVEFGIKHDYATEQLIRDTMARHSVVIVEIDDIPREPSKNVPKELRQLVRKFKGGPDEQNLIWHVKALVPDEPNDELVYDIQDVLEETFGLMYFAVKHDAEWGIDRNQRESLNFSDLVDGLMRGDKLIEERKRGRSR